MADRTGIEWTDATWNPVRGCSRVSAGCQHCYAETVAGRFSGPGQPYEGLIHPSTRGWNGQVRLVPEALAIPWRWTRPRRIFVNSMSDLFHPAIPFEFIAAVFFVMAHTTRHTYQVLTKRPERMIEFFEWLAKYDDADHDEFMFAAAEFSGKDRFSELSGPMDSAIYHAAHTIPELKALPWAPARGGNGGYDNCGPGWPYANVWLGVSVEDQAAAEERIPLLLQCPAAVRWISAEPLLGPVDLMATDYLTTKFGSYPFKGISDQHRTKLLHMLDWVVAGGESGSGARPMHPGWARTLRDQCASAGVPFLFKQWGAWRPICQGGQDWYDSLYRSRRVAKEGESQVVLDDVWGRSCRVENVVVQNDGATKDPAEPGAWQQGSEPLLTFCVGKKAAGRLLDGVQHDGYPEVLHG